MKIPPLEQDIFDLIDSLQARRAYGSLTTMVELLSRLGNPHQRLPKTIHVAGTNGKGSVLAFLDSILRTMSYRTHRYTSPHLVSICERVQISNQHVTPERFLRNLQEIAPHTHGLELTYFDLITAVAFMEFSQEPADFLLLETGLGGRYDATNVVSPVATVITQIGLDHMDLLGSDLKTIAREKAGIIKADVPVVTIPHDPDVMKIIEEEASCVGAPLHVVSDLMSTQVGLLGDHQHQNAILAYGVARLLNVGSEDLIRKGIQQATWPGRMQLLLIKGRDIWLDMAHNASAAEVVVQAMRQQGCSPFHLIFSMRATKDARSFLDAFKGNLLTVTYVPLPAYVAGHEIESIQKIAQALSMNVRIADQLGDALSSLSFGPVLVTGSAILLGEALATNP
jgi:dihydrofolate synthase/folylpolyglutamate synthase